MGFTNLTLITPFPGAGGAQNLFCPWSKVGQPWKFGPHLNQSINQSINQHLL